VIEGEWPAADAGGRGCGMIAGRWFVVWGHECCLDIRRYEGREAAEAAFREFIRDHYAVVVLILNGEIVRQYERPAQSRTS
jgi:hypothetical protein